MCCLCLCQVRHCLNLYHYIRRAHVRMYILHTSCRNDIYDNNLQASEALPCLVCACVCACCAWRIQYNYTQAIFPSICHFLQLLYIFVVLRVLGTNKRGLLNWSQEPRNGIDQTCCRLYVVYIIMLNCNGEFLGKDCSSAKIATCLCVWEYCRLKKTLLSSTLY